MKSKTVITLLLVTILLIVVALCITFFRDEHPPEDGKVVYSVMDSIVENNTARVKILATIEDGQKVDPISQVRIIEGNNLISYPLNGYPKTLLSKGESFEFEFTFLYPSTEKATLEITNSGGKTENLPLSFPEVANRDEGVKFEDSSLAIGEDLTVGSTEKYLVNNYRFSQVGDTLPPEGTVYLIVNLTLENIGSSSAVVYVNKDNFTLKNEAGDSFEKASDKAVGVKKEDKTVLKSGEKTILEVAFIVPKDEKNFQLFLNGRKIFIVEKIDKQ